MIRQLSREDLAHSLAQQAVCVLALGGRVGQLAFDGEGRGTIAGDPLSPDADGASVLDILARHRPEVEAIAEALLASGYLDSQQLADLADGAVR